MPASALVQTRIDAEIKERAAAVLANMGLTVSDAVRILLTRTANEGGLPLELLGSSEAHEAWLRAQVRQALKETQSAANDAASSFEESPAVALGDTATITR